MKTKTFPVACGVSFDACMSGRKYQELVPNSNHRSLAYWEQMGDATRNANEERNYKPGTVFVYDIPARLLVWLNMSKMNLTNGGATTCSIAAPVAIAVQTALSRKSGFLLDQTEYPGGTVQMLFQAEEAKDAQKAFGRYSYGDLTKFMLHPFDFFTLRYVVRLRISPKCVEAFTIGEPIDCNVAQ
jgi:hypothetical protein